MGRRPQPITSIYRRSLPRPHHQAGRGRARREGRIGRRDCDPQGALSKGEKGRRGCMQYVTIRRKGKTNLEQRELVVIVVMVVIVIVVIFVLIVFVVIIVVPM